MKASSSKTAKSSSNSGHKNITYNSKHDTYVIDIKRSDERLQIRFKSLEDAIKIRDKIYDFFDSNGRLPYMEEIGIERRHSKSESSDKDKVYICKRCGQEFYYTNATSAAKRFESAFKERGDICGFCEFSIKPTISTEISDHQRGRLNEKYVSVYTRPSGRSYYAVRILKNHRQLSRSFLDLNDAIDFRDIVVEFYNTNGRLPSKDEQDILFPKCPTSKIARNKTSNNSKRDGSSTELDNISRRKDDGRYNVRIIRDNVYVVVTFKTLEEAIIARDMIFDEYDKTGRLMTRGEVIANLTKHQSQTITRRELNS